MGKDYPILQEEDSCLKTRDLERECMQCHSRISLPHFRVWEENAQVSTMLCFCDKACMVAYYTNRHKEEVASFTADEYHRLPIITEKPEEKKP